MQETIFIKNFLSIMCGTSKVKNWQKDKNRTVIGRINSVNPKKCEKFYLRLLLNHVTGSTSFQDLLTVDEIYYL